jgi:hypothetical protein
MNTGEGPRTADHSGPFSRFKSLPKPVCPEVNRMAASGPKDRLD